MDNKLANREEMKIDKCTSHQLYIYIYKPKEKLVLRQLFCDCEKFLKLEFNSCEKGNCKENVEDKYEEDEISEGVMNEDSQLDKDCINDQFSYI